MVESALEPDADLDAEPVEEAKLMVLLMTSIELTRETVVGPAMMFPMKRARGLLVSS